MSYGEEDTCPRCCVHALGVCIHAHTYTYTHAQIFAHIHPSHVCIHAHTCKHTHTNTHSLTLVTCAYMYACTSKDTFYVCVLFRERGVARACILLPI
jgi:hypothetical protein